MITLPALTLAAALLPGQPSVKPVHWLDDIPAQVGLQGCVRPGSQTHWDCTGAKPLPESVAAAAASGTTSMGGGRHGHGKHHSHDLD